MSASLKDFIKNEFQAVKNDLHNFQAKQDALLKKIDELTSVIELKEKRIKDAEARIQDLSESVHCSEDLINDLSVRLAQSEQYLRKNCIEINNVVQSDECSDMTVVMKLSAKLNLELIESDVEVVHRVPPRNKENIPAIIVKFFDRKKRDKFLLAKKSVKTLKNKDINPASSDPEKKVFINESMSTYYKQLMWKAKQRAKEKSFEYVWFTGGKLLARKTGERDERGVPKFPAIRIVTEFDLLNKLV